ncbi:MAG: homoserine kinase [Thermobacillus sp.]|nr:MULTISPECIES: homoserine kinase [Thermobacillus]REK53005.1 MAG: homoserine kinase [Thermobacillus sp.]
MMRRVLAKVPASTANLGPGFDALGMALSLYSWIEMAEADDGKARLELFGKELAGLPAGRDNLIYKAAQLVYAEAGVPMPELHIAAYTDIPLARGLGSSAAAIVGGLAAANALIGSPLPKTRLLEIASDLEGHPDNVGACLFGGIVAASWDGNRAKHVRLDPPPNLEVLVAIPSFRLPTERARHALPDSYSRGDAVFNIGRSSLLVAALAAGRLDLLGFAMQDRLHQPYRAALIPGMSKILAEAPEHGALGAALSGAGPTMLAFVDSESTRKAELERFLLRTFAAENIAAETLWLKPASAGPEIVEPGADAVRVPLFERIKGEVRA